MEYPAYSSPEHVIEVYVESCRQGDIDRLRSTFLEAATMSGIFQGEFYIGSPEIFFEEVRDNPLNNQDRGGYVTTIHAVEVCRDIASIVLTESGYLGNYSLTNLFHLVATNGEWKIASKLYSDAE